MRRASPGRRWTFAAGPAAAAALAVLVVVSVAAAGDIYRWVDENGEVHYSNAPSRMQSREEPVRVPVPAETPAASEQLAPEDGGGETGAGGGEAAGESVTDATAPDAVAPNAAAGGGEAPPLGTAAQTTLQRISLESDYRRARARLKEVDRELAELAAARTRFAVEGPPSVGGEAAVDAPDVRSPEEIALEEERQALVARLDDIRARYTTLRGQVAAQYGGKAPAIWQDLR